MVVSVLALALAGATVLLAFTSGLVDDNLRMIRLEHERLQLANERLEHRKTRLNFEFDSVSNELRRTDSTLSIRHSQYAELQAHFAQFQSRAVAEQLVLRKEASIARLQSPNAEDSLTQVILMRENELLRVEIGKLTNDSNYHTYAQMLMHMMRYDTHQDFTIAMLQNSLDECNKARSQTSLRTE